MSHHTQSPAAPFLKWAGGKGQLLEQYASLFPTGTLERYYEPFVGSGAVFFYLQDKINAKSFHLSDINVDLINCYKVVRDHLGELIPLLAAHKEAHHQRGSEYYYEVRDRDRQRDWLEAPSLIRAARMIYLNKTCYNGLWRVNSQGHFNVPMGRYKNPDILNESRLKASSEALQGVEITVRKFEDVGECAQAGDFVYFDPPYVPLSETANFTSYSADSFGAEDQRRLAHLFAELSARQCIVMQSNSDTEFVHHLYEAFRRVTVTARRAINSNRSLRGSITELVILNY